MIPSINPVQALNFQDSATPHRAVTSHGYCGTSEWDFSPLLPDKRPSGGQKSVYLGLTEQS